MNQRAAPAGMHGRLICGGSLAFVPVRSVGQARRSLDDAHLVERGLERAGVIDVGRLGQIFVRAFARAA